MSKAKGEPQASATGATAFDPSRPAAGLESAAAAATADVMLPSEREDGADDALEHPATISLTAKLTHLEGGFISAQLDDARISSSRLTRRQSIMLKVLRCSMNRQGVRMANGRYVQTNPDAMKCLLDQFIDQVPELIDRLEQEAV